MKTIPQRQFGFSLIEVLVALVVVSIGILGLAGLQHTSVRNNHNALLHSQASFLAYEIADYMRSNRAGVQAKNYEYTSGVSAGGNTCVGSGNVCSASEMANYHLLNWQSNLENSLPAGTGSITCMDSIVDGINCTPGSRILISVKWSEAGINGEEDLEFITEIIL